MNTQKFIHKHINPTSIDHIPAHEEVFFGDGPLVYDSGVETQIYATGMKQAEDRYDQIHSAAVIPTPNKFDQSIDVQDRFKNYLVADKMSSRKIDILQLDSKQLLRESAWREAFQGNVPASWGEGNDSFTKDIESAAQQKLKLSDPMLEGAILHPGNPYVKEVIYKNYKLSGQQLALALAQSINSGGGAGAVRRQELLEMQRNVGTSRLKVIWAKRMANKIHKAMIDKKDTSTETQKMRLLLGYETIQPE